MKRPDRHKKLSTAELEAFFQQLALFLKSGIPTWEGLALLGKEADGRNSELFLSLSAKVSDGSSLSAALIQSGRFPSYAVDMVRMGSARDVCKKLQRRCAHITKVATPCRENCERQWCTRLV